jgi:hypothetical protein
MFSGAYYKDPVMSWFDPIAVTSVAFLSSSKFATQLNNILVGDSNFGQLYLFTPNATRDGLILTGGLVDTVADSAAEREVNRIGTGFSTTTDLEIGPDGYMYGVSLGLGDIWRIVPVSETVAPTTLSMFRGSILGGGVADLASSDDSKLVVRPGAVLTSAENPVQVILESTNPASNPLTQLSFVAESSATATGIREEISLYNFSTGQYDLLNTRIITGTDSTATVNVTTTNAQYIESGTKLMRARLGYKATTPLLVFPYQVRIDAATWTITR